MRSRLCASLVKWLGIVKILLLLWQQSCPQNLHVSAGGRAGHYHNDGPRLCFITPMTEDRRRVMDQESAATDSTCQGDGSATVWKYAHSKLTLK